VLTGNLGDGTAGLRAIKEAGGVAIVQDPDEAMFPSMPQSAARHVRIDHLVPLQDIAPLLASIVTEQ
jgi:two-component system chemotaxis response regulator CheB